MMFIHTRALFTGATTGQWQRRRLPGQKANGSQLLGCATARRAAQDGDCVPLPASLGNGCPFHSLLPYWCGDFPSSIWVMDQRNHSIAMRHVQQRPFKVKLDQLKSWGRPSRVHHRVNAHVFTIRPDHDLTVLARGRASLLDTVGMAASLGDSSERRVHQRYRR